MVKKKKTTPSFQQVLAAMTDETRPFPPAYLHYFSGLGQVELDAFRKTWPEVKPDRRAALIEDLEDLADSDERLNFDDIARLGLRDADARVRVASIRILWESQDKRLVSTYLAMMVDDEESVVRATAASALGPYVYMGELEELPADMLQSIEERLLEVAQGADEPLVRRRALEALGYSSREEVSGLIEAALEGGDVEWVASALFAMGVSSDDGWGRQVVEMLEHEDNNVVYEAIRSSGQLELDAAREPLLAMLDKAEELEQDLRMAIVHALSQIGGERVQEALEELLDFVEDEEEADFIAQALEYLEFIEGMDAINMIDVDASDENALYRLVDPEGDDDEEEDEFSNNGKPKRKSDKKK